MASQPENPPYQLEERRSVSKVVSIQEDQPSPEGRGEDERPLSSFIPPAGTKSSGLRDLTSVRAWRNHIIWRAGVRLLSRSSLHLPIHPPVRFQVIEGVAAGSLNFVSGLLFATLSTWPRAAVPVGILFGNAILVSVLVSATAPATGAHINPLVTIATLLSGLCHPVRAAVYIFCQLVGGALGGTLLRVALGRKLAYEIHNAGCWIDPEGEVDVWQAALIEFTCVFILLFVLFPLDQCWSHTHHLIPGSWLTESDWIPAKRSNSARNTDRCSWD